MIRIMCGKDNNTSNESSAFTAFKFPRTPHLPGSAVIDDDRVIAAKEVDRMCSFGKVVLQEKLDGCNVGVFFAEKNRPVCQKRAGLLEVREKEQYNAFRNWVWENYQGLWSVLNKKYVIFGEWLWQTHAVFYDSLPEYFIAYDVLDRENNQFLTTKRLYSLLQKVFHTTPELWRGEVHSSEMLSDLVQNVLTTSAYSNILAEGIYIRFETDDHLIGRAKYRRPDFSPGRKSKNPTHNQLAG